MLRGFSDKSSIGINVSKRGIVDAGHTGLKGRKGVDGPLDLLAFPNIVLIRKGIEVAGDGATNDLIEAGRTAEVSKVVLNKMHVIVGRRVLADDLNRRVVRAVVAKPHLDVVVGLPQDAIKLVCQIFCSVVCGKNDANPTDCFAINGHARQISFSMRGIL